MANITRNTFRENKNFRKVIHQRGKTVVDADYNEGQDILRYMLKRLIQEAVGDGAYGDSLKAVGESVANQCKILAGHIFVDGEDFYNEFDIFCNTLTNAHPTLARHDLVYIDIWEREVNSAEDSYLILPTLGEETCVRLKLDGIINSVEGTAGGVVPALPVAPLGHTYKEIASILRPTADNLVYNANVTDRRNNLRSAQTLLIDFLAHNHRDFGEAMLHELALPLGGSNAKTSEAATANILAGLRAAVSPAALNPFVTKGQLLGCPVYFEDIGQADVFFGSYGSDADVIKDLPAYVPAGTKNVIVTGDIFAYIAGVPNGGYAPEFSMYISDQYSSQERHRVAKGQGYTYANVGYSHNHGGGGGNTFFATPRINVNEKRAYIRVKGSGGSGYSANCYCVGFLKIGGA